jgi:pyridoxine/pyridoxamine 5'-phosphate oxidase
MAVQMDVEDSLADAQVNRCEVQFDYGLRQRRSRPLESRPASFVSKQGKTISVQKTTAAKNDKIQSKGKVRPISIAPKMPSEWNNRLSTSSLRKKYRCRRSK